ncbi:MAG: UDP-N-acetylmuramoyl-L-alanyl-D-glutamate--2,6-diaminopimelate ligase [Clostridia bacterium]|nr:UDP-N-acetylmuramoyl-L-alanyl-D-glutamate--2,6-diaminopimelate ligase [Clostridia bacterium]
MNLQQILQDLSFKGVKNYKNVQIDNLTNSSTKDTSNALYFCLKGSKVDGHDYAEEAVNNGAVCLVVERYLDLPVTQILVDNSRLAMSTISAKFYEFDKSQIRFIGVTGTNGKTTTSFITRHILQNLGKRVGMIGTEGIYIGDIKLPATLTTPDPIQLHKIIHDMDQNNIEFVVMEVSAHAIALNKIDSIMYDVVGLTNITQDHLDYFNTMENYARAKAELFTYKHAQKAIINIDDKYTRAILKKCNIDVKTLSLKRVADIMVEESELDINKTEAVINIDGKHYMLNTSLTGEYNLANTLMAVNFCASLGFEITDIMQALNKSKINVPGRLNLLTTPTKSMVVIDYAHTPDGIEKVLSTLNQIKRGDIIVVFGCGGNRDNSKRAEMGKIATNLADYVVITSDNPRDENPYQIIADINKGISKQNKHVNIENRASAINYALAIAKENDIVAILGKGNEAYQEIKGEKQPFSDYKVVEDYFNKEQERLIK